MRAPAPAHEPVCLIGAGSSGLAAARVLVERGLAFDAFELGSDVGGVWRYRNDSGRSPAYASLETNTSRDRTAFRSFPMRDASPGYLHHGELLSYLESFADRFGLRDRIRFGTGVVDVSAAGDAGARGPASGGAGFVVTVRDVEGGAQESRPYGSVIVATGHHWDARVPELTGMFEGSLFHSRDYRTPDAPVRLADRNVLVIGIGNSACDIACEAAGVAAHTLLSTRRGAHVLPKWLLGRPIDRWITPLTSRLPVGFQAAVLGALVRLGRGDQRRFGVPRPDHRLGREHPTLSQDLPRLVRAGRVEMCPDVERLERRSVRFVDGRERDVDVIVCATGYHVSFPFLSDGVLDRIDPPAPGAGPREKGRIAGNRIRLFRHVVPPDVRGLFFLGLVQPLGAIPPLAEAQAEWVADLLDGSGALPSRNTMRASIEAQEEALGRRFVRSARHTLEVDFYPYLRTIARERREGRARARAARGTRGG